MTQNFCTGHRHSTIFCRSIPILGSHFFAGLKTAPSSQADLTPLFWQVAPENFLQVRLRGPLGNRSYNGVFARVAMVNQPSGSLSNFIRDRISAVPSMRAAHEVSITLKLQFLRILQKNNLISTP
jgi:hypothetical protein